MQEAEAIAGMPRCSGMLMKWWNSGKSDVPTGRQVPPNPAPVRAHRPAMPSVGSREATPGKMPSGVGEQELLPGDGDVLTHRHPYGGKAKPTPDVPLPRQSLFDGKGSGMSSYGPLSHSPGPVDGQRKTNYSACLIHCEVTRRNMLSAS